MNNSEVELIKLPLSLGVIINDILKEKIQFEPRKNKAGILSCEFTNEELALIDKLYFDNPTKDGLKGIELLPNLKSLIVKSDGNTLYRQDKNIASISDKDASRIAKCKNLEFLDIENQARLSFIDVSELKRLHTFIVKSNVELDQVFGLKSLKELWQLDCIGNENLTRIEDLNEVIMNNQELTDLNLDVLLYPDAVGYDMKTGSVNEETIKKFEEINVSWQEILCIGKNIKINNFQMMSMHKKACKALEEYVPQYCENRTAVVGIERYLAENVKYDKEALNNGHSHSYESKTDSLPSIIAGPIGGANGAYNAFTYNTCVCEGYTRAMQYLLRLRGIKSHNVFCISGEDKLHMSTDKGDDMYKVFNLPDSGYHSIISIDDVDYLYDDPCWNAKRFQEGDNSMPYILLTKEEISKSHTLSFGEKNIDNNTLKVSRDMVQVAMQRIENYREDKRRQEVISEQEIGKTTINTDIQTKDNAQKQIQNDLQKLQEKEKNK